MKPTAVSVESRVAAGVGVAVAVAVALAAIIFAGLNDPRSTNALIAVSVTTAIVAVIAALTIARMTRTSLDRLLDDAQSCESELRRRTDDLEVANKDLEAFAHTVSHDLRGPLGSILGFGEALRDGYGGKLNDDGVEYTQWIVGAAIQMRNLIDGLLRMSRLSRLEMQRDDVDLSAIAGSIAVTLQKSAPERTVEFTIAENVAANGDERLLRAVLENLIANAWKFTGKRDVATIEFGMTNGNGHATYFVRDNGAGFDPTHASKMFRPFQRLHSSSDFEGAGIGLATVQRLLQRHGGKAWADGEPGKGATIYFTTGAATP